MPDRLLFHDLQTSNRIVLAAVGRTPNISGSGHGNYMTLRLSSLSSQQIAPVAMKVDTRTLCIVSLIPFLSSRRGDKVLQ